MDLSVTTNISKGGENIYPLEIEERLVQHPAIARAIVVGISHPKYVEVPVGFLLLADNIPAQKKPDLEEVKSWVRQVLGRHKAPTKVFWLGEECSADVPLTGSGKIKKFVMRGWAEELLKKRGEMQSEVR
jgi:acyl-CoA synthetase (AMP-forming)/AMP-acid ligase II